ncbi:MAG TPA: methyltransferase domain-containing protein [Bacteroidetes bacterium]|nr:methyltransferase domain-containing protein [Bacteroidota bacterium]
MTVDGGRAPEATVNRPPSTVHRFMQTFTNQDITDYYDHTEPHYRQWWKMEDSMGLHYGVWGPTTKTLSEAILNTNSRLAEMGKISPSDKILDAGCGVGGSSIFLAKKYGCRVAGITLSERQVRTATSFSEKKGVAHLASFAKQDYTNTHFPDNHFDVAWAIESMQTATDKSLFFKEIKRVLKPGGRLLIADVFKKGDWKIAETPVMQTMLNGWAMSDILSIAQLEKTAEKHNFALAQNRDVSLEIIPSIKQYYRFAWLGMIGTKWYNLFHDATYFSKTHYKTGFAQYKGWKRGLWEYRLLSMVNDE